MKRILFVDDDVNVVSGLQRMLHRMANEWEMDFVTSAEEALEAMNQKAYDAIVSDMRMPRMNGAELLQEVRRRHPNMVRFILSGYSDHLMILQSVGYTHQFLAKPCDAQSLIRSIKNSLELRRLMVSQEMMTVLTKIRSLPNLPRSYRELTRLLYSDNASMDAVARVIAKDVGMTTTILRLVNTAFFGLPTKVKSPLHAVNLLGLETIRALVLTAGVFEYANVQPLGEWTIEKIYSDSLAVGNRAQRLARQLNLEKPVIDYALIAGLTHEIGRPIQLIHLRDKLKEAVDLARQERLPMYVAETRVMGVSHAAIGAYLLALWGETDPIVEAVAFHHEPSRPPESAINALTCVHIAAAVNELDKFDDIEGWKHTALDWQYIRQLGLEHFIEAAVAEYHSEQTEV